MKWVRTAIAVALGVPLLFLGALYAASELGGEVVVLHRPAPDGSADTVRIWIVEDATGVWIEHGSADADWIQRVAEDVTIKLERDGAAVAYRAVPDPTAHTRYHELRRAKYGWADALVELATRNASEYTGAPVRLDPVEG